MGFHQEEGLRDTAGPVTGTAPQDVPIPMTDLRRTTRSMAAADDGRTCSLLDASDDRRTTDAMEAVDPPAVEAEAPHPAGVHAVTAAIPSVDPGQTATSLAAVDPGKTSTSLRAFDPDPPRASRPGRPTPTSTPREQEAAAEHDGDDHPSSWPAPRSRASAMVLPAVDLDDAATIARVSRRMRGAEVVPAEGAAPVVREWASAVSTTYARSRRPGAARPAGPAREAASPVPTLDARSSSARPSSSVGGSTVPVPVSRRTTASLMAVDARRITLSTPAVHPRLGSSALSAIDPRRVTASMPSAPVRRPGRRPGRPVARAPLASIFAASRDSERVIDLEDLEQARLHLEQVTARAPRDLEAAESLVVVLVDLGRLTQASVELLRLAVLYVHADRASEAQQAVEHAYQLEPACLVRHRLAPFVFGLGPRSRPACESAIEGHLAAGRLAAARDVLALLVEAQPAEIELRHRLAKAELLLGNTPTAVLHLRVVVDRYRAERQIARLVPAVEELLRHGGPDTDLLWELTLLYLQADLHERALEKLEQLHRLVPSDLEIVERVANLQARLGRMHAALGSLWRLIIGMQNAGAGPGPVRELLERARHWSEDPRHRGSIDGLLRKAAARARGTAARL